MKLKLKKQAAGYDSHPMGSGVTFEMRQVTAVDHIAAEASAARTLKAALDGQDVLREIGFDPAKSDWADDPDLLLGVSRFLVALELGTRVVKSWSGIVDDAGGPAPLSREWLAALFRDPNWLRQFEILAFRSLHELESEGNVSGTSPNGSLAAGETIAEIAGPSTATAGKAVH